MERVTPLQRDRYKTFVTIPTRWGDNDVYGHVNNAVYYAYFDTAVNHWLIKQGLLKLDELQSAEHIGLVVDNRCQ